MNLVKERKYKKAEQTKAVKAAYIWKWRNYPLTRDDVIRENRKWNSMPRMEEKVWSYDNTSRPMTCKNLCQR